jgi:hypothetical protein
MRHSGEHGVLTNRLAVFRGMTNGSSMSMCELLTIGLLGEAKVLHFVMTQYTPDV